MMLASAQTLVRPLYTIHSSKNTVYATKPPSDALTIAVVSFEHKSHAELIASMLEEYKRKNNEWPPLFQEEALYLPNISEPLLELEVMSWTKKDLDVYCVEHFLDLITVTGIKTVDSSFEIHGETYKFEVPDDTYKDILEIKYLRSE